MTDRANDNVNHPAHYTSHPSGVECITIARNYCFSIGNGMMTGDGIYTVRVAGAAMASQHTKQKRNDKH